MSTTAVGIRQLSIVILAVADQERSIEFYVDKLGLEKRTDVAFGDDQYRWVEVYPQEGTAGIALAPPRPGTEAEGINTGITLTTTNIDATHAELRDRGVDVDAEVSRMGGPVPPMFWFRDPDGNTLMIVESAS